MPPQRQTRGKKRSTPYAGGRGGGRGAKAHAGGRGGRGATRGGRGRGRGGRGNKAQPKTAEQLDQEMDKYWGKSEEHALKRLNSDMDDYWKNKEDEKPSEGKEEKSSESTGLAKVE